MALGAMSSRGGKSIAVCHTLAGGGEHAAYDGCALTDNGGATRTYRARRRKISGLRPCVYERADEASWL